MKATIEFQFSEADCDDRWDRFLLSTPNGQFQQSTAWGRIKRHEAWQVMRIYALRGNTIRGGIQLLWKSRLGIRIGFINKGPVLSEEDPSLGSLLIKELARRLGLAIVLIQTPDSSGFLCPQLQADGFIEEADSGLITATALIDIGHPHESLRQRYSSSCRNLLRKLWKSNMCVVPGTEADAGVFFGMMTATCARHQTAPSPSTAEGIAHVLREFSRSGTTIPEIAADLQFCAPSTESAPLCGQVSIRFGKRVTAWKKGSVSDPEAVKFSRVLQDALLMKAHDESAILYDFMGMSRALAEADSSKKILDTGSSVPADTFKFSFGAKPSLLPKPMIWSPNRLLRGLLKVRAKYPTLAARLGKLR